MHFTERKSCVNIYYTFETRREYAGQTFNI